MTKFKDPNMSEIKLSLPELLRVAEHRRTVMLGVRPSAHFELADVDVLVACISSARNHLGTERQAIRI